MTISLTETLGNFVAETSLDMIPEHVIDRAKVSLVHNLAVALAGRPLESVAHVAAATFWASPGEATLLANGRRTSAEGAAFANAALMHARSQDDTHAASTSHPGGPVISTALAVGEARRASGEDIIRAIVLGYEVLGRVGRDFDHLVTERGYRSAAVFGVFGAAASAAAMMRLPGDRVAHALGLATNLAGGTAQVWAEGGTEGGLQLGFAARNGLCAARLASVGATAAGEGLEGRAGVYRTLAGANSPAVEVLDSLGEAWQLTEVTVKPHPVCAILQGPVEALLDMMRKRSFSSPSVTGITLELCPFEATYPGVDNPGPFSSAIATKLSAQFCLALVLDEGRVTPAGLARLSDGPLLDLSRLVSVVVDPTLKQRLSRTVVMLDDGSSMIGTIDAPVGQPSFADVGRFARDLAPEMNRSEAAVDRLVTEIDQLDRAANLDALLAALA